MTKSRLRTPLKLTRLEARDVPSGNQLLAVAEDSGASRVAVYTPPTDHFTHSTTGASPDYIYRNSTLLATVTPYPGFHGGVRLAIGDVTGDGVDDVVTAPGFGGGPHIKVFDGAQLLLGKVVLTKEFFAFESAFRGGAFVSVGQMDSTSPQKEIVVGAGESGGPHVRVFAIEHLEFDQAPLNPMDYYAVKMQNEFFAFDGSFQGGVRVATGDVNGDGRDELIAAAGPGGGPHVRVFDVYPPNPAALYLSNRKLIDEFYAYDAKFRGGVYVAAGNIGDYEAHVAQVGYVSPHYAEVITGPGEGGGPDVKVFSRDGSNKFGVIGGAFLGSADSKTGARVGLGSVNGINGDPSGGTAGYPLPTIFVGFGAAPPSPIGVNARPYGEYRIGGLNFQSGTLTQTYLNLPPGLGGDPTQGLFVGL